MARIIDVTFRTTPEYLSEHQKGLYNDSVIRLMEIGELIVYAVDIVNATSVPLVLSNNLNRVIEEFLDFKNNLSSISPQSSANYISSLSTSIYNYHSSFFAASSSNKNMMIITAITNYNTLIAQKSLSEFSEVTARWNKETEEFKKKATLVDAVLAELETPSAEKVLSNYANEYKKEAKSNNTSAYQWLSGAIGLSILFVVAVILSIYCEWFPSVLKLTNIDNGKVSSHEIIHIPVLVTKVLLVSILVFIIVFCFRQYSIYKNLSVINMQRMNAFNSYVLFVTAIGESDVEAKKALLMSLAKTIHESINTGFLAMKDGNSPVQNIDLSKLTSL